LLAARWDPNRFTGARRDLYKTLVGTLAETPEPAALMVRVRTNRSTGSGVPASLRVLCGSTWIPPPTSKSSLASAQPAPRIASYHAHASPS